MASQYSDEEPSQNQKFDDNQESESSESEEEQEPSTSQPKSALKKSAPPAAPASRPYLPGLFFVFPTTYCSRRPDPPELCILFEEKTDPSTIRTTRALDH